MPHPKVKISDNSGNTVDVTESNELKVKLSDSVTVTATDLSVQLDHANDSVQLWGNESAAGSGTARALLTDSDGHLQVDVLSATLGTVSVQSNSANLATESTLSDIDTDTGNIASAIYADDGTFNLNSSKGIAIMGYAGDQAIQADDIGVLTCTESGKLDISIGHTSVSVPTTSEYVLGFDTYEEDARYGSISAAVRNNALESLVSADNNIAPLQVDAEGALYTTHGMTGMAQGNTTVGTSAMQLDEGTNGYDVACKRVDLTSDPNNAGHIYVGSADTIAADGSVGGIRLNAGDFYSLDINNLTHIWVEASEAGQELNFIYYT